MVGGILFQRIHTHGSSDQGYIVYHDVATWDVGESLSPGATRFTVTMESAFLVLILILTIGCVYFATKVDKEWSTALNRLPVAEPAADPS